MANQCQECGAEGPGLKSVVVGGRKKTLCAECNPYIRFSAGGSSSTAAADGGEVSVHDTRDVDDVQEEDDDEQRVDVDEAIVAEIEDLLKLQTRRRGRDHWCFTVEDLGPYLPDHDDEDVDAALRELSSREDVPITIWHDLDNVDGWVARPVSGGEM